jgi:hypothetical protein
MAQTTVDLDDETDPLAVINAELREKDTPEEDPDSPWLPLESNPVSFGRWCAFTQQWLDGQVAF